MGDVLTPVVFVAAHCTHPVRPARVWEVALVKVQPQAAGMPVEVGREAFRIEMNSTRDCDQDHLQACGFFARHPFGAWLAGKGEGPPPLAPGPSLAPSHTAARRIARATYGCDVAAWNVTREVLALTTVLHGQHLAPTWSGRFLDLGSMAASWLGGDDAIMPLPRPQGEAPPAKASALDLAVWDADYWSRIEVAS